MITLTVAAVVVPPAPVDELARRGAAMLVEEAVAEFEGDWIAFIAEDSRSGIEMHGVLARDQALDAVRDRWTVVLRSLIADTPDLAGWTADVTILPEADDDGAEPLGAEVSPLRAEPDPGDDEARERYRESLVSAADSFRALPMEHLIQVDLDDLGPDDKGAELMKATYLAGCLMHAAEIGTDELFSDVADLARAQERDEAVDIDSLFILGDLPPRFADRYGQLFAQKLLVAFADMTRRLTAGWEPLVNVAQELSVRLLLNRVEMVADLAGVDLPDDWRATLEEYLFEDTDHEYLYDPAADGFEDDADFGPPGMAPMNFEAWFVPFNDERHLPVYATDRHTTG
jgi:hypothetical protein